MTPERLAALEKAAAENGPDITAPARLDETQSPVAGRRFTRADRPRRPSLTFDGA